VVLAALLAYAGTLTYGFVWDDPILIRQRYERYTLSGLPELLGSEFFAFTTQPTHYYRPVITLTFFLDLLAWGLRPAGFHLTNVLAHALVSTCVFWLARRATGPNPAALLAGVLFAVHPTHSESVAFVSGRTDVFAALFMLTTMLAYARWRDSRRFRWSFLSLASFALALLSKEVAVMLPVLLPMHDWLLRRELRTRESILRSVLRYAPYLAVLGAILLLRYIALGHLAETTGAPWADGPARLLTSLKLAAWYARIVLVPFPDNLHYLIPTDGVPPGPMWWLSAAWLLVLLALTALTLMRWPAAGFAALWFWVTLAPSMIVNVLPVARPIMAERYLYVPSVGVCILLGLVLARACRGACLTRATRLANAPCVVVGALLVLSCATTIWRNEAWKDDLRLNLRMVETSPEAPLPHYNLGLAHLRRGDVVLSHVHLKRAQDLQRPESPWILATLGLVETLLGDREAGLTRARRAHARAPDDPVVLTVLADVHRARGEMDEARRLLQRALAIGPDLGHPPGGARARARLDWPSPVASP
jgi:protein O-mannosyl-transferase